MSTDNAGPGKPGRPTPGIGDGLGKFIEDLWGIVSHHGPLKDGTFGGRDVKGRTRRTGFTLKEILLLYRQNPQ